MSLYQELLINELSTEGIQRTNLELKTSPEGDGLIAIKEVDDTEEFRSELDTHLNFLANNVSLEDMTIKGRSCAILMVKLSSYKLSKVNGIHIPDVLHSARLDATIKHITKGVLISELSEDVVYYVTGDDADEVEWLLSEGFYAGDSPQSVYDELVRFKDVSKVHPLLS